MLKRLSIRGFKSIRTLEDFELRDLNVLIGANGAGKSNFIALFQMLSRLMDRSLRLFVREQDGPNALFFGGRKRTKTLEAKFIFDRNGYEFSLVPAGDGLVFADEATLLFGDWRDVRRPLESKGQAEAVLPDADDSFATYVRPAVAGWRVYHFHDTSPSAAVRHSQAVRDNRRLKPDAGNLAPFLRRLREQHSAAYRRIVETIRSAAPFFGDFVYRQRSEDAMDLEWSEYGDPDTVLGPRQLSDGTLRFICLATLLLQPSHLLPKTLLIDEPELGLHPYAVSLLGALLQEASEARQVIVSTQSVDLISELRPQDIVVVSRRDGESVFERPDPDRLRDWLEDYALGDLWKMNVLGGRPAR
jgi:predicted ATPase